MNLRKWVEKGKNSRAALRVLTMITRRVIPFNRPHNISIISLSDDEIITQLPYIKRNLNHVRGLHACAMATLAEFTSGFLLLSKIGNIHYRIIMKSLVMEYFYQGKSAATGYYRMTDDWVEEHIRQPLQSQDQVLVKCPVKILDREGNHLCTGTAEWQVKKWSKVRTRV